MARGDDGDFYKVIYNDHSPRRHVPRGQGYDHSEYARQFDYQRNADDAKYGQYGAKGGGRDGGGYGMKGGDGYMDRRGYEDKSRPRGGQDDYRSRDYHRQDGADPFNTKGNPDQSRSNSRFNDYPTGRKGYPADSRREPDYPSGRQGYPADSQRDVDYRSHSRSVPDEPKKAGYDARQWQQDGQDGRLGMLLQKFRGACMKRGTAGIKSFGRMFRQYDDDGNKKLNLAEFRKGVREYGLGPEDGITDRDAQELFNFFDRDGNGQVNFDELLQGIRPPMSDARKKLVAQAFYKLDTTGDGVITVEDLKNGYDVEAHPKFKSGEKSKTEILIMFLENFEAPRSRDGRVTREEWLNYYAGVSASIDKDVYFDLMMRQAWRLDKQPGYVGQKARMMVL